MRPTRKNNRFFGQSKLTGAQAQPLWLPIYFGKAQVAHFHMKMLQNLLISARARPKKRRGGKKRGPNLKQFFSFCPTFQFSFFVSVFRYRVQWGFKHLRNSSLCPSVIHDSRRRPGKLCLLRRFPPRNAEPRPCQHIPELFA
jgi:hypothetical protein